MSLFRGGWGHYQGPAETQVAHKRPEVGDVVAWNYAAWEVVYVKDAEDLREGEEQRLTGMVEPYRSECMPYAVELRRLHGPKHEWERRDGVIHLRCSVRRFFHTYPSGRVPLCSCHSHPWPCREFVEQQHAEKEAAKAEHEMQLLPGCCPACQEPVTQRQQSIAFPGPYLRNPLADPNPVFHLRRKCWHGAKVYEEAWVREDPTRPRSLLTLSCSGILTVHHDGTAECHGRNDGTDCPSVHAHHRGAIACYYDDHGGCPLGCPREGHPGIRVAGRPTHPREITRVEKR